MARIRKKPTQLSERNRQFYQKIKLLKMSENTIAATDRTARASTGSTKKAPLVGKGKGQKRGGPQVPSWKSVERVLPLEMMK